MSQIPPPNPPPNPHIPPPNPPYSAPNTPQHSIADDPMARMLLPVGRSTWAIVAGYLGLISVLCFPAPFALVAAILAIRELRNDPKLHGMGRAVFGLVMGALGCAVMLIWLIALVIAQLQRP